MSARQACSRRNLITLLAAVVTLLATAGPASAHVYLDLDEADAGEVVDMTFIIPHGCGDLATTALYVSVPDGVVVSDVRPPPGFTGESTPDEVAFTGGNLVSGGIGAFAVTARLPDVDGRLHFPSLQECGEESIPWLDIPGDGRADGQPAPSLVVQGGSVPTGEADEVAPEVDDAERSSLVWPGLAVLVAIGGTLGLVATRRRGRASRGRAPADSAGAELHAQADRLTEGPGAPGDSPRV